MGTLTLLLGTAPAAGQEPVRSDVRGEVFVNSETERYLRVLQVAGQVPVYQWSIRSFSPAEVDRLLPADSLHPWAGHYRLARDTVNGLRFSLIRPQVRTFYNSAFPHGANDGAVWAGKGVTTAVEAGFQARMGRFSLTIAPTAFVAQNAEFELTPIGSRGDLSFKDPIHPDMIDLPQRFGDEPYARLSPGQSTLRYDGRWLTGGVSTANQHWGPAVDSPLLLGSNAEGYRHLFVGTATPASVGVGRVHGRFAWGWLDQSEYSFVSQDSSSRFTSSLVVVFQPRGLNGLELGIGRFFHSPVSSDKLAPRDFFRPLEGLLKSRLRSSALDSTKSDRDNQLATVFARWLLPDNGFEVYGEFSRDDHSGDLRDLLQEPDHDSAYLLGFRKVWGDEGAPLVSLRGEVVNSRVTHLQLVRPQVRSYIHSIVRQGHTHGGQLLGSPAVAGGAGAFLTLDRYTRRGRISATWSRTEGGELISATWSRTEGGELIRSRRPVRTVLHGVGGEVLFFAPGVDLTVGVTGMQQLNRHFRDEDAFNLNLRLGARASF